MVLATQSLQLGAVSANTLSSSILIFYFLVVIFVATIVVLILFWFFSKKVVFEVSQNYDVIIRNLKI